MTIRDTAVFSLREAVADLDLTDAERHTLTWLQRWEPETVANIAAIIGKARKAGM